MDESAGHAMTSSLRVLIVEDEVLIGMMLEEFLLDLNFQPVGPIEQLEDALAAVTARQFDIALLDVNLGVEVSYPVADALAERGIPFAFMSGSTSDSFPERYGEHLNLTKPYKLDDVSEILTALSAAYTLLGN